MNSLQNANGDNAIQINKSKNINISVVNNNESLVESIHQNIKKFDLISLSDNIDSLKRMTNASDNYDIFFDTQYPNTFRLVPKISNDNQEGIFKGKCLFVLPEEYKKFKSFSEIARYSYLKQKPIILTTIKFEVFIGQKSIRVFENDYKGSGPFGFFEFSTNMAMQIEVGSESTGLIGSTLTIIPSEFPPPIFVNIENQKDELLFANIALRLKDITDVADGSIYTISNFDQEENPIYLEFQIKFKNEGDVQLFDSNSMVISLKNGEKVYYQYIYYKLLNDLMNAEEIILRGMTTGNIFSRAKGFELSIELKVQKNLKFWKEVLNLERVFNVDFIIPDEFSLDDYNKINKLKKILKKGILKAKGTGVIKYPFKIVSFEVFKEFVHSIKEKHIPVVIQEKNSFEVLFGNNIILGSKITIFPKTTVKNIEYLEQNLLNFETEQDINIELEINNETPDYFGILIYPSYYGTEDLGTILKQEHIVDLKYCLIINRN